MRSFIRNHLTIALHRRYRSKKYNPRRSSLNVFLSLFSLSLFLICLFPFLALYFMITLTIKLASIWVTICKEYIKTIIVFVRIASTGALLSQDYKCSMNWISYVKCSNQNNLKKKTGLCSHCVSVCVYVCVCLSTWPLDLVFNKSYTYLEGTYLKLRVFFEDYNLVNASSNALIFEWSGAIARLTCSL